MLYPINNAMHNFHIPEQYQSIAVLFSGGMDSTLLLYLAGLRYPHRRIIAVTAGCSYINNRVHLEWANKAFAQTIKRLTPGAIDYHITHYHDDRETHHCNQAMVELKDLADVWLIGQNASPPQGAVVCDHIGKEVDLYDACPLPHRRARDHSEWAKQHGLPVYRPLANIDKQDEVRMFKELKVFDLIQSTRSCPGQWADQELIDFVPHCGYCWWCLERQWGLMV
jgi:tRNA(Ile)-lysidine synthase TilS/MesJ